MSKKSYKQRKVRARSAEFSVEDLPSRKIQRKRGRENESHKAVEFCAEQMGNWCKLFTYSYAGIGKNLVQNARVNCSARRRSMRKHAEVLGVTIELRNFNDVENNTISVYARALKYTNNRVSG